MAWNYLQEALLHYHLSPSTLKIDMAYPLPISKIKALMSKVDTVVVLEELEPIIEETVMALRADMDHPVKVVGKLQGPLSVTGDYNVEVVTTALREVYGDQMKPPRSSRRSFWQSPGAEGETIEHLLCGLLHTGRLTMP